MDFNLYKEHYSSTYHVALCSVFKGLDNFQPLFESHLFDQICSDTSKFLKWKLKKKKREKKDSWCTMYSFPLMYFRNSILWRITAKMLTILTLLLVIVTKLPQWAHCAALAAPSYLMSVAVIICLFFFPLIVIYYGIIGCFNN